jgi:dTDP-4-amino-4,6-dideoxygalactose transaminase
MAKVRYSYITEQFNDPAPIFAELAKLVATGRYTLGPQVAEFEDRFAAMLGVRHAIGVGSGTDALKLSLKALGVGPGDEVITAANTFIATVGAIHETGARAALVDCEDHFCLDVDQVEAAITPRTRAIMPVQFTGEVADMPRLMAIAAKHGLPVVEDACQGILSEYDGRKSGSWGMAAGFSLHPLKNLNVWGDGGVIVTNDDALERSLRLLRNHGLKGRDEVVVLGCNSRLDTLQAVVGNWLIGQTPDITDRRIANGAYYDAAFSQIPALRVPPRRPQVKRVFHLYMVFAEQRDALFQHCLEHGIQAKVHYPIPLYQQEGLKPLGYAPGRFPVTDRHAREVISFPVDQHLSRDQQDQVIDVVRAFYAGR